MLDKIGKIFYKSRSFHKLINTIIRDFGLVSHDQLKELNQKDELVSLKLLDTKLSKYITHEQLNELTQKEDLISLKLLDTKLRNYVTYEQLGVYTLSKPLEYQERPHYEYIVNCAAELANKLGYKRISVIEFGVAGGNGLVSIEKYANQASEKYSLDIEVYGFDSGEGLPEPTDYRDQVYNWRKGFYKMDIPKIQSRLKNAKLVLGDIENTRSSFFNEFNPAPIGAIVFDFDYYSSTKKALEIFKTISERFLPRVFCFFDDIVGGSSELHNDYTGVRLAINEFNEVNNLIKITIPYHIVTGSVRPIWHYHIRICHIFEHKLYNTYISESPQQLPLS